VLYAACTHTVLAAWRARLNLHLRPWPGGSISTGATYACEQLAESPLELGTLRRFRGSTKAQRPPLASGFACSPAAMAPLHRLYILGLLQPLGKHVGEVHVEARMPAHVKQMMNDVVSA